jgi:uncharacterized protein (DUF1810 family)
MTNTIPVRPDDPFDLDRFVIAQNQVYSAVLEELQQGRKQSHWIWYIFPQVEGLGYSSMANKYGICSRPEAEAYLAHPVLAPRLVKCTELVNGVNGRSIEEIFGQTDALKFRSSMTLFGAVASDKKIFLEALNKYFGGQQDQLTLDRLQIWSRRLD